MIDANVISSMMKTNKDRSDLSDIKDILKTGDELVADLITLSGLAIQQKIVLKSDRNAQSIAVSADGVLGLGMQINSFGKY
jgi:hypothetical protein